MDTPINVLNVSSEGIRDILEKQGLSRATNEESDASLFDGIYKAAVNMISSTNDYLHQANQAEVDYASGKLNSTHELAVIEQKASLSLQYTVAVKNQLLQAYREIMNMQI